MVSTRGKTRTSTSDETVENSVTELCRSTSDSPNANIENSMGETPTEERVQLVEEVKNDEDEKIHGFEESEIMKVLAENDFENDKATDFDGCHMEETEKDIPEDDETSEDELGMGSTDQSEEIEENVAGEEENISGEYELNEEENEEQDGDDDEANKEEGIGEDADEGFKASEEEANKDEGDQENIKGGNETTNEDRRDTKEHNTEFDTHLSLKNDAISTQKRRKKKKPQKRKRKVSSEDKPEPSSNKKKAKKKVKSMGMIFMCSSKTKPDCYKYGILGLPENKKDLVIKIYSGMRLFLYDVDLKLLYGIYKAAGPGGYNIEPRAFKSQFPSQVRFTVLNECLPLAEERFKNIIKDNYFTRTKFDCTLNSKQVKELCKLFLASSEAQGPAKLSGNGKVAAKPVREKKASRLRAGDERHHTSRDNLQISERPRKRPREARSPVSPLHRLLPQLLPPVDRYRRDQYPERRSRSPYRNRRNPGSSRHNLYRDSEYPPTERRDYYREELYRDRQYSYRGSPGCADTSSDYPLSRSRALYLDPRDSYRDEPDLYARSREPYRLDPYLDRRDLYRDRPYHEPYSSAYKRDPFRDRQELPGSYRREEVMERRRDLPLNMETRRHDDIRSRDSYRGHLPYPDPIYSAEYRSRVGVYRL